MTLLSIREQEAVKQARHPAIVSPNWIEFDAAELAAYDRALILATRDAIARQVMEENARLTHAAKQNHDTGDQMEWRRVATFIEGLEP